MRFSGFVCWYSVSHCSNKPTIKIIDWQFLCQWANIQNQQGIKYFFPHCTVIMFWCCVWDAVICLCLMLWCYYCVVYRLLLLLYLLYIGTFTLCCVYRPLKDAPENYTVSDMDKTIRVQKTLKVRETWRHLHMTACVQTSIRGVHMNPLWSTCPVLCPCRRVMWPMGTTCVWQER